MVKEIKKVCYQECLGILVGVFFEVIDFYFIEIGYVCL